MLQTLQNTNLSWDLSGSPVYEAGSELEFMLTMKAPGAGRYYLLGALYDTSGNYIGDTLFGVLVPEGSNDAVNNQSYASLWDMNIDEEKSLPCRFTFNTSNVILGLFLLKMVGNELSMESDELVASVSVPLSSPVPPPPVTLPSLFMPVLVVGVMGFWMYQLGRMR